MALAPPIIGLAGGIGSGKSTVAKYFRDLGIETVDADDVARLVVEPGSVPLQQIQQRYGDGILLTDGSLDRKALREIIFHNVDEKKWLESITHPAVRKELQKQLQAAQSDYVLLVHPLLFETGQNSLCHFVVALDVPQDIQLKRVISRDHCDESTALNIIHSQLSNHERLNKADFSLENAGNINKMNAKVLSMHEKILGLLK
ncbi:dephospho-CoA kinase [Marinomonas sp. THO17]|uniref:dephospho-CoA kinase n=1 Tax=Marinomonas sp. THO17 TaxID=3149048 RepID=UPI00336C0AC3